MVSLTQYTQVRSPRQKSHLVMRNYLAGLMLCAIALALGGCQAPTVSESLITPGQPDSEDARMDFWHNLAEKRLTSNEEAFRALLLFANGQDHARSYNGRVMDMKAAGYLPKDFNRPANEAVTRGTVAYALVQILGIEGGVTMRLFGPSERYATRELRYHGLYPQSSDNQTFSGGQFVGVIGRAEDWQRNQKAVPRPEQASAPEVVPTAAPAPAATVAAPSQRSAG